MSGEDVELRLTNVKNMLDELTKEMQHLIQREVERSRGEDPQLQPYERCVARVSSATLMLTNVIHDLSSIKLSVLTLHGLLGCDKMKIPKPGKKGD